MLRPNVIAWSIASAFALNGCSLIPLQADADSPHVRPAFGVQHGGLKAEHLYRLGRYFQGQGRFAEAAAAYRDALAADPMHADAHNGLGVAYAEQGRYTDAVASFHAALALKPLAAHVHNNLGYTWLLQGEFTEATKALQQALDIEPGNEIALRNLRLVKPSATGTAVARAASPAAAPPASAATPAAGSPADVKAAVVEPNLTLATVAPGIYELRPVAKPAEPVTATPARVDAPPPQLKPYKLEVSNGNGVNNMARRVAEFLDRHGITTGRLTNAETFVEPKTLVEYRPGYRAEAMAVAETLPRDAATVEASTLRSDIHVRIVLGHDVRDDVALFESRQSPAQLAARALRRPEQ